MDKQRVVPQVALEVTVETDATTAVLLEVEVYLLTEAMDLMEQAVSLL